MDLTAKKALYTKAKNAYYNSKDGKTLMSDAEFDALEDSIRKADPTWSELDKTGVKVGKKTEVALRVPMPSLNKIYLDDSSKVDRWLQQQKSAKGFHVSPKLDGASIQLVYQWDVLTNVITRGDGTNGKDVSYFIPYLRVPKKLPATSPMRGAGVAIIRCEAIMSADTFESYKNEFETPRAAVSGILNRQDVHPALKRIDIVALRVLALGNSTPSPRDSSIALGLSGFNEAAYVVLSGVTTSQLVDLQAAWRKTSPYNLDGIVVVRNEDGLANAADKPKHSVAFKDNAASEALTTKVKSIVWQTSRYGALTPKAELEPVRFSDGTTVKYATLHNAEWAQARSIGPGAVVKIIRSGEIIPKIVEVVRIGIFQKPDVPHVWVGPDLYVKEDTHAVAAKRIEYVLSTLGYEHVGSKVAEAIASIGKRPPPNSELIRKLLNGPARVFVLAGLSEKMVAKVVASLKSQVTLEKVIMCCGIFPEGLGERRAGPLADAIRNNATSKAELQSVFGPVFGAKFYAALRSNAWAEFVREPEIATLLSSKKAEPAVKVKGDSMRDVNVSWTGYRSEDEELWVQQQGGSVVPFGAKTAVLLYKEGGKASSKLQKARDKGIRVITFAELKSL